MFVYSPVMDKCAPKISSPRQPQSKTASFKLLCWARFFEAFLSRIFRSQRAAQEAGHPSPLMIYMHCRNFVCKPSSQKVLQSLRPADATITNGRPQTDRFDVGRGCFAVLHVRAASGPDFKLLGCMVMYECVSVSTLLGLRSDNESLEE